VHHCVGCYGRGVNLLPRVGGLDTPAFGEMLNTVVSNRADKLESLFHVRSNSFVFVSYFQLD